MVCKKETTRIVDTWVYSPVWVCGSVLVGAALTAKLCLLKMYVLAYTVKCDSRT